MAAGSDLASHDLPLVDPNLKRQVQILQNIIHDDTDHTLQQELYHDIAAQQEQWHTITKVYNRCKLTFSKLGQKM